MIETTSNKVVYVVSGNPVFAFPIPFFSPEDIHCYLYDGESERELDRGTDFEVEVKQDYSGGADVRLLGSLTAGNKLTIVREVPLTQDVNLPEYGKLPTTALEAQLDKFIMICQQLKEITARSFAVPHGMDDYDNDEIYNAFREMVDNAEEWAETASEGARAASSASARAAVSATQANGSAAQAEQRAENARTYADTAYEHADEAAAKAAEIRRIALRADLNRVTLHFGAWGEDDGAEIDYGDWTDAASISSCEEQIREHDEYVYAHDALMKRHDEDAESHGALVERHNADTGAHAALGRIFVPAGTVFAYAGSGAVPAGFLLCDGALVSRTAYGALFSAIGTAYGSGDGTTTFALPDFRGMFLRGYLSGTSGAIGSQQAEGLPNITGRYAVQNNGGSQGNYADGAFGFSNLPDESSYKKGGGWNDGGYRNALTLDASRSNAVYGASGHVTPVNYAVQYIIKY